MNLKDFSAIQQVIINEELNRLWNDSWLGIEGNEPKLMRDLLCEMEQKGDVK